MLFALAVGDFAEAAAGVHPAYYGAALCLAVAAFLGRIYLIAAYKAERAKFPGLPDISAAAAVVQSDAKAVVSAVTGSFSSDDPLPPALKLIEIAVRSKDAALLQQAQAIVTTIQGAAK